MPKKIDLVGNASDWIRYSDYQIKETSTGEVYILPSEGARFNMYNPFNVAEDLIIDLIDIGDIALQFEKDNDEETKSKLYNDILIFAKKYGLLGLISASTYNRNIIGDEVVLLVDNNPISTDKIIDEKSYLDHFIPFTDEGDIVINHYKNSVDVVKREDSPKYHGKRPVVLDLVFSKFYSEQIDWVIDFAKMISSHFNQLLIYKNSNSYLTENVTIMAGKFQAHKMGFTIEQLDKTTISWQFDSLKTAIETIYAFAVTDESTLIDRCSHCKSVFIANNSRKKYCDTSCRNRANVQKSRQRNK